MDIQSSYALLEKILVLKKSALFSSVTTSELRSVAEVAEELHFMTGERIVAEKEIGDALFLIKTGQVEISKNVDSGRSIHLATLDAGECFGEMAAIDEEVRSATVTATVQCDVLKISKDNLHDVLRECPQIGIELLRIFVKRLRLANSQIESLSRVPA